MTKVLVFLVRGHQKKATVILGERAKSMIRVAVLWWRHLAGIALGWCMGPLFRAGLVGGLVIGLSGCNFIKMHQDHMEGQLRGSGIYARTIELSNGSMRYFSGGHGFPIMFVHGFGGDAAQTWKSQLHHFSKSYRVYAPDIYWFGDSLPKSPELTGNPFEQADAIAELLDRHGIARAHVVGVSFGGYISLAFALRHPQKVARLVVVDAAGLSPSAEEQERIKKAFAYANGNVPDLLIPQNTKHLRVFLDRVFYKSSGVPDFALDATLKQIFWKNKEQRTRIARYLSERFLLPEQLQALRMPTAVFWGKHDPLLLPTMGQRLARSIPQSQFYLFEQSGHMPMFEEPALFNQRLGAFLDANAAALAQTPR